MHAIQSERRKTLPHNGLNWGQRFLATFPVLTLILMAKLVCEVALLCLLGRGVLSVLAGPQRAGNPFYALLRTASQPWVRGVGWLTRARQPRPHHAWGAFALLTTAWLLLTWAKVDLCVRLGVGHCR